MVVYGQFLVVLSPTINEAEKKKEKKRLRPCLILMQTHSVGDTVLVGTGKQTFSKKQLKEMMWLKISITRQNRDSLLVECQTHDRKVASLNAGWICGRIFFSRVDFLC